MSEKAKLRADAQRVLKTATCRL